MHAIVQIKCKQKQKLLCCLYSEHVSALSQCGVGAILVVVFHVAAHSISIGVRVVRISHEVEPVEHRCVLL